MNSFVQRSELRDWNRSFTCVVSTFICVELLCSCISAPKWYPADAIQPVPPPETSFNPEAGRGDSLFVTLQLADGEWLLFGVDTGSPVTILDQSLVSKLGERLEIKTILTGYFGKNTAGIYKAPALYLDTTRLSLGDQVQTQDLSRWAPGHPLKGILGMDCLRHYCLQLDFTMHKMRFFDPDHLVIEGLGKAFPLSLTQAGVTVQENLLGIGGENSGIDTGEYLDGALRPALFQPQIPAEPSRPKTSGDKSNCAIRLAKGEFGGNSCSDLILRENHNGINLVGLRFLARHLVTFNFPKQTLYLKRERIGPWASRENNTNSAEPTH